MIGQPQTGAGALSGSAHHVCVSLADEVQFHESLLLGNGRMGAALYGSSRQVRLNLNRTDIWDYRYDGLDIDDFSYRLVGDLVRARQWNELARLKEACMRAYMKHYPGYAPAGELQLIAPPGQGMASAVLTLDSGVAAVQWLSGAAMSCFVSSASDVLAVRLSGRVEDSFGFRLFRHPNAGYSSPQFEGGKDAAALLFRFPDGFEYAIAVNAPGWRFEVRDDHLAGSLDAHASISVCFVAISTSRDGGDPQRQAMAMAAEAVRRGWDRLLSEHQDWWAGFWGKSDLTLQDADLERAWRSQIYQLGACSRQGSLPPNLQGIWNAVDHPDWHSNWTLDLNVQITAWPVFTANHPELALPFAEYLLSVLPEVKRQTERYWGLPGAKFGSACDPLGREFFGYLTASYWAGSTAWTLEPVIWYWRNTKDEAFARSIALPLIDSALDFYHAFLVTDADGVLHVPLTTSPESWENGDEAWGRDSTLDLAALRQLARGGIEIYHALGSEGPHRSFCQQMLRRLAAYPVLDGAWSELDGRAYPEPHRHLSVLAPVYPIAEMDEGPEAPRTALASYRAFVGRGPVVDWGCTLSWLSAVASRLGLGEEASHWLARAKNTLSRSLLHRLAFDVDDWSGQPGRSIYEIDGGAGFAAALNEMLLSSLRGPIRLFPSAPDDWSCAFRDFRAEGGFLVSSGWSSGRIGQTAIVSLNGGACLLERTGRWDRVHISRNGRQIPVDDDGRLVRFNTEEGARYDVAFD